MWVGLLAMLDLLLNVYRGGWYGIRRTYRRTLLAKPRPDALRPMAGKKVGMSGKWPPAAARRPRSTGRNRCLAVIETRVAKWEMGGLFPNWTRHYRFSGRLHREKPGSDATSALLRLSAPSGSAPRTKTAKAYNRIGTGGPSNRLSDMFLTLLSCLRL